MNEESIIVVKTLACLLNEEVRKNFALLEEKALIEKNFSQMRESVLVFQKEKEDLLNCLNFKADQVRCLKRQRNKMEKELLKLKELLSPESTLNQLDNNELA